MLSYSPRLWGWSAGKKLKKDGGIGIPHACGGDPVFSSKSGTSIIRGIPHACGGDPGKIQIYPQPIDRIPHACGGDPMMKADRVGAPTVFPTLVGVIRCSTL